MNIIEMENRNGKLQRKGLDIDRVITNITSNKVNQRKKIIRQNV